MHSTLQALLFHRQNSLITSCSPVNDRTPFTICNPSLIISDPTKSEPSAEAATYPRSQTVYCIAFESWNLPKRTTVVQSNLPINHAENVRPAAGGKVRALRACRAGGKFDHNGPEWSGEGARGQGGNCLVGSDFGTGSGQSHRAGLSRPSGHGVQECAEDLDHSYLQV